MNEFEPVGDDRDWARKIMRRYHAGEKINQYPLRCAREVLRLPTPAPAPMPAAHYDANRAGAPVVQAPAPAPLVPQAMTPAEAFYAAERAASSAYGNAAVAGALA